MMEAILLDCYRKWIEAGRPIRKEDEDDEE